MSPVGMRGDAFNNGGKLNVVAVQLLKEVVKLQRIVCIVVVHDGHGVPLYVVLFQQVYSLHYFDERGSSLFVPAVFVVKLLRTVDGDAHQPLVVVKEPAPLIGKQCAVGLYAVDYLPSPCISLL